MDGRVEPKQRGAPVTFLLVALMLSASQPVYPASPCTGDWHDMRSAPKADVVLEFDGDIIEVAAWDGKHWVTYGPSDHVEGNPEPLCWRSMPDMP